MDKALLDSLMKLQGVSIEYSQIDDDEFNTSWTFIIKGLHPMYSAGQLYRSKEKAQERAEGIVNHFLLSGE